MNYILSRTHTATRYNNTNNNKVSSGRRNTSYYSFRDLTIQAPWFLKRQQGSRNSKVNFLVFHKVDMYIVATSTNTIPLQMVNTVTHEYIKLSPGSHDVFPLFNMIMMMKWWSCLFDMTGHTYVPTWEHQEHLPSFIIIERFHFKSKLISFPNIICIPKDTISLLVWSSVDYVNSRWLTTQMKLPFASYSRLLPSCQNSMRILIFLIRQLKI